ncbi:MAG: hypothetical protein ABIP97_06685 [Chthoniobacterales bacterium]
MASSVFLGPSAAAAPAAEASGSVGKGPDWSAEAGVSPAVAGVLFSDASEEGPLVAAFVASADMGAGAMAGDTEGVAGVGLLLSVAGAVALVVSEGAINCGEEAGVGLSSGVEAAAAGDGWAAPWLYACAQTNALKKRINEKFFIPK